MAKGTNKTKKRGNGRTAAQAPEKPAPKTDEIDASVAAAALGRLGGLKGGKARALKLTAEQRTEIARKAAQARWESHS
jgi:hypothetical protein